MLRNTRYSEWLLPYLEGGLDEARRAQLEARLAVDPALAAEARQLARTVDGLRGTATRTQRPENASVPADLWPHLRARLVLDPAPRPRPRAWWLAGVGAPAAAALLVAAFWLPGLHLLMRPVTAPNPVTAPKPVTAPEPAAAPKAVTPTPVPSVVSVPAALAPAKKSAAALSAKPMPMAKLGVAKPGAAISNAPPATPFDLPTPAPPAARAANGLSTPQSAPAPPGAGASRTVRLPGAAAPSPPAMATAPLAMATPPLKPVPPAATPPPAMSMPAPPAPPAPLKPAPAAPVTAAAAGAAVVSKEVKGGPDGNAFRRAKSQANVMRLVAPTPAPPAFAPDAPGDLDSWQAALAAAVHPPLWGRDEGDARANEALMAARESGQLDDLRARLEVRRAQSPRDVATGRMLASVYDFGFSPEPALRERRRITGLEGADGEDWYALARAEERAGNRTAAQTAYRRALESPVPPSPFHAAIARGK